MDRKIVGLALFALLIVVSVVGAYVLTRNDRGLVVTYARSGGFAGTTERLTLFADGTAVYDYQLGNRQRVRRYAVRPALLARVQKELDRALAAGLDDLPLGPTCADCFQFDITYRGRRYTLFHLPGGHPVSDAVDTLERVMSKAPTR